MPGASRWDISFFISSSLFFANIGKLICDVDDGYWPSITCRRQPDQQLCHTPYHSICTTGFLRLLCTLMRFRSFRIGSFLIWWTSYTHGHVVKSLPFRFSNKLQSSFFLVQNTVHGPKIAHDSDLSSGLYFATIDWSCFSIRTGKGNLDWFCLDIWNCLIFSHYIF